jgi:hypothetical protein
MVYNFLSTGSNIFFFYGFTPHLKFLFLPLEGGPVYGDVEPGRHPGALTNMEKRQPKSWGGEVFWTEKWYLYGFYTVFLWILYGSFVDFMVFLRTG